MSLVNGMHIECTNICTLKCPGCSRTQFINQWPKHWSNRWITVEQLSNFLDIDLTNCEITLCGNQGDPIYHPEFHSIVKFFKLKESCVTIVTNGSYKTTNWWQQLVALLDENDKIVFSIDGLPSNFTEYRINGDWDSIKLGIDVVTTGRCKTIWKFIPFRYNQHDIEQARQLSVQYGFDKFEIALSDRFDSHTEKYKPDETLISTAVEQKIRWHTEKNNVKLNPKCSTNKDHYISADGYYSPCCYVHDFRFYQKTSLSKNRKEFSICNTTFSKILKNSILTEFNNSLESQSACQYNCAI